MEVETSHLFKDEQSLYLYEYKKFMGWVDISDVMQAVIVQGPHMCNIDG